MTNDKCSSGSGMRAILLALELAEARGNARRIARKQCPESHLSFGICHLALLIFLGLPRKVETLLAKIATSCSFSSSKGFTRDGSASSAARP